MNKNLLLIVTAGALALSCSRNQTAPGTIAIRLTHEVDGEPLQLGQATYQNEHGDCFTVSDFQYYVSNLAFINDVGDTIRIPESYFLVNHSKPKTMQLVLDSVPPSTYIGWEFLLGVDSLRNLQGDQSGALDPAHNMYWSWKTGYIFMRFKGDSPESPLGKLHFDVGGIKPQTNTIRSLSFAFQEPLRLRSGMVAEINVAVDLAHLFKGGETIDFANIYRCMGGPKAVKLADNYANGMFEMRAVEARQ